MISALRMFLSGRRADDRGRSVEDVLAFSDDEIEATHDFIQWLFPLPTPSSAQPSAPVLDEASAEAIRTDGTAQANLRIATARMLRFYERTNGWLRPSDHNHLRITRIIRSLGILVGREEARVFYDAIQELNRRADFPVDPANARYWADALD